MKKNLFVRLLTLAIALLLLSFAAVAEEEFLEQPAGYVPERGMSLPFTAEDMEAGYGTGYYMAGIESFPTLPIFELTYTDIDGMNAAMEKYSEERSLISIRSIRSRCLKPRSSMSCSPKAKRWPPFWTAATLCSPRTTAIPM